MEEVAGAGGGVCGVVGDLVGEEGGSSARGAGEEERCHGPGGFVEATGCSEEDVVGGGGVGEQGGEVAGCYAEAEDIAWSGCFEGCGSRVEWVLTWW